MAKKPLNVSIRKPAQPSEPPRVFTIELPEALHARLMAFCKEQNRDPHLLVSELVSQHLDAGTAPKKIEEPAMVQSIIKWIEGKLPRAFRPALAIFA